MLHTGTMLESCGNVQHSVDRTHCTKVIIVGRAGFYPMEKSPKPKTYQYFQSLVNFRRGNVPPSIREDYA